MLALGKRIYHKQSDSIKAEQIGAPKAKAPLIEGETMEIVGKVLLVIAKSITFAAALMTLAVLMLGIVIATSKDEE